MTGASRAFAYRLTDETAMAQLRARVSGSLMVLIGLVLIVASLGQGDTGHKLAMLAVVAPFWLIGIVVMWAGSRLSDLMFVLSQCFVELLLVPIAVLGGPDSGPASDSGLIVPILIMAVFAGRRSHVALQVATTILSLFLITLDQSGSFELGRTMLGEVFAFIALAIVARLLRELAQDGMQQAEAALLEAEKATRRAELGEITDHLTGLLNRRGFERTGKDDWNGRALERLPLAVLLVDVDHFKKVNDSLGHAAGDALLRSIAVWLTDLLGDGGTAYRLGGEEFAVLARCDPGEAAAIAERVRYTIERELPITVSIGVLEVVPDSATDLAALWRAVDTADHALYAAKHAGRNRVVAAGVPDQEQVYATGG